MASNTRDQSHALSTNKMVTGPPLLLSLTDFSHFTDFPTLRIIIWPTVLSVKGINRSEYHHVGVTALRVHLMDM